MTTDQLDRNREKRPPHTMSRFFRTISQIKEGRMLAPSLMFWPYFKDSILLSVRFRRCAGSG